MRTTKLVIGCALFALLIFNVSSVSAQDKKFDEFGNTNCEDEMARLDNFTVAMNESPEALGYIFVYGGRYTRRGEALMRLTRIKNYLVNRRGMNAARLVLKDGGFRKDLTVVIYIIPPNVTPPAAAPTLELKDVRFKKGRIKKSEYECSP